MRYSVDRTTEDPADLSIALLKREEEQIALGNIPADGKLSHYRIFFSVALAG